MAEAIFRHMVKEKGQQDRIIIDSSGTGGYHIGKPPHEGTKDILDQYGISYEGQKALKLEKKHLKEFDLVVAMDEENLKDINALKDKDSTAKVCLLSNFSAGKWVSVPDPWYTGNFNETYELVNEACGLLLDYILKD